MADSTYPNRERQDALIEKVRRSARQSRWTVSVAGGVVRFKDGTASIEVSLDAVAADFEQTMLLVAAHLSPPSAGQARPVIHSQDSYYSAPWHEFDSSGIHISARSG